MALTKARFEALDSELRNWGRWCEAGKLYLPTMGRGWVFQTADLQGEGDGRENTEREAREPYDESQGERTDRLVRTMPGLARGCLERAYVHERWPDEGVLQWAVECYATHCDTGTKVDNRSNLQIIAGR